jgi:hypothetical protein
MSTFYEQRMLNLFVKYGISDQVQRLIKNLEEVKTAQMGEGRLATMIRMSPTNRSVLIDTMVKWCVQTALSFSASLPPSFPLLPSFLPQVSSAFS